MLKIMRLTVVDKLEYKLNKSYSRLFFELSLSIFYITYFYFYSLKSSSYLMNHIKAYLKGITSDIKVYLPRNRYRLSVLPVK